MELKNLYRGRIREYAETYGCKYVEGARPWGEKGDIALPSATQNELNGDDARKLVANGVIAVSEGANMPSTPEAIKVFQDAKILYAPGKAANAGGVSVSGLEMTQNSIKLSWSSEEVDEKLKSIMKNIHEACVQYGTEPDGYVNYVKGANVAGFMKVAKAMMAQGNRIISKESNNVIVKKAVSQKEDGLSLNNPHYFFNNLRFETLPIEQLSHICPPLSYLRNQSGRAIRRCEYNYPSSGLQPYENPNKNGLTGITNYIEEPVVLF